MQMSDVIQKSNSFPDKNPTGKMNKFNHYSGKVFAVAPMIDGTEKPANAGF